MNTNTTFSPALLAAQTADAIMLACLKDRNNFLLEAGAGAGKTFSLVEALKNLISEQGTELLRNKRQIACITYTNAATAVITNRIDNNPLVYTDTIHAFCWNLIKSFQPMLRSGLTKIDAWHERLDEAGDISSRKIEYDLGHRRITDESIYIHHDDVLALMVDLLPHPKFQAVITAKYPFILIDEYQDTDAAIMDGIKSHLMGRGKGPQICLFGDHFQRIYDGTCGHVRHEMLKEIGKGANFRSSTSIVKVLNSIRPELPQAIKDETFVGSARVYHTNDWRGTRRSGAGGGHWKGDLPSDESHRYLQGLIGKLTDDGWNFSPDTTKILMLTHNVLASEQGYENLIKVFPYSDSYIKKQDDYIAYFSEKIEPACDAYARRRYGEMFSVLGNAAPKLKTHQDKIARACAMDELLALRESGTIGEVIEHISSSRYPLLPDSILRREAMAHQSQETEDDRSRADAELVKKLHEIPYRELVALDQFINGHTPFATKHSVKGDEFENVLVVFGRGWNKYNFDQYLQWVADPSSIPSDKMDSYERYRNLFYVCCSRPTTRLTLFFTQLLSQESLNVLRRWFGPSEVQSFVF